MNNTNETQGIHILTTNPQNKQLNVNVNSTIDVEFSSDIDMGSLVKNIIVLQDINRIFKGPEDLKDYSQYSIVKGNISYQDKIVTYTPSNQFEVNSTYIVLINNEVTDITGNKLKQKYLFSFTTEEVASYGPCEIISPKYGNICSKLPYFTWKNQHSPSYEFQISKVNSFETLLVDEIISGNEIDETISYIPDINVQEGIYHIRVKSENGEWSNVHQIFIKPITDDVVASEDTPVLKNFDEFLDDIIEPLEILEVFPEDGSTNVSLKTNIFYIKMKGKVDKDRINFGESYIYGESIDEDEEYESHYYVDGIWTLVYDSYDDVTYLIFNIIDTEEQSSEEEENPEQNPEKNPENPENSENQGENNPENTENGENSEKNPGNNTENNEENTENNENLEENTSENSQNEGENTSENSQNEEENDTENEQNLNNENSEESEQNEEPSVETSEESNNTENTEDENIDNNDNSENIIEG